MAARKQTLLFPGLDEKLPTIGPVNVASVQQRSPFRYPGGKTWFVPSFRLWCSTIVPKPKILVEPFAGGGIISLTALFENIVNKAVMVEMDDDVAAVWETIIDGNAEWLANQILKYELSRDAVIAELNKVPTTRREVAFQTILKNRTYHGGILAAGSGLLKYGEKGKGIHSRWYPSTIARRLVNLVNIAPRIDFRCDDGLEVLREFAKKQDVIYFIDPPYTAGGKKAGKRLYKYSNLDHEQLFSICKTLRGDFLMTYDNADEVKEIARNHGFQMRLIPMTNTHNATMEELVIGKDLSWMDGYFSVHEPKPKYGAKKPEKPIYPPKRKTTKSSRNS